MKKTLILVVMYIVISLPLSSQGYFYVSTSNERLKPNLQKEGRSNDEALNRTFQDAGVRIYRQSFPGAKNPELQSYYTIHLADLVKFCNNSKLFFTFAA